MPRLRGTIRAERSGRVAAPSISIPVPTSPRRRRGHRPTPGVVGREQADGKRRHGRGLDRLDQGAMEPDGLPAANSSRRRDLPGGPAQPRRPRRAPAKARITAERPVVRRPPDRRAAVEYRGEVHLAQLSVVTRTITSRRSAAEPAVGSSSAREINSTAQQSWSRSLGKCRSTRRASSPSPSRAAAVQRSTWCRPHAAAASASSDAASRRPRSSNRSR